MKLSEGSLFEEHAQKLTLNLVLVLKSKPLYFQSWYDKQRVL